MFNLDDNILIKVNNITKKFYKNFFCNKQQSIALNNVSFNILNGKTVGLIGASGSGKSTLGKILVNLLKPDHGKIIYKGQDVSSLTFKQFKPFRRDFQMVFQDPFASFNNLLTIEQILSEGLRLYKICDKNQESDFINHLLNFININPNYKYKHPSELSGGECQRIAIARCLSIKPKFIVFDEATSALDYIVQKQIVSLIKDIQQKLNLSYLFISHNIKLIKYISDIIIVLLNGKIVESGSVNDVYYHPQHPYTKHLVQSFNYIHTFN